MCVVSMVADHYRDRWTPYIPPNTVPWPWPVPGNTGTDTLVIPTLTQTEIEQVRRDAAELKLLLERAREYDRKNGEPECENDEKIAALRKFLTAFGIDPEDIMGE